MTDLALSHWQRIRAQEPPTIRDPQDYDGGPAISIGCTQTDLPAAAQKRLVAQWCELLPTLTDVRQLWFRSQVPQRLLDAAARMPALTDLWVKWSSVESLEALGEASSLVHLHLGGSARVQSLAPLVRLTRLQWLTLENTKQIQDLRDLARMPWLQALGYSGGIWGKPAVDSLAPLSALTGLTWLDISGLQVRDGSLRPLAALRSLQAFHFPNTYALEEYAFLRGQLPQLAREIQPWYSLERLGLRCKACGQATMVALLGHKAGHRCLGCEASAVAAHVQAFEALVRRHGGVTDGATAADNG